MARASTTLSLEDQATIANMAPEYGATCGFFPVDADTLRYLSATDRHEAQLALVEAVRQGAGHVLARATTPDPVFTSDDSNSTWHDVVPSDCGSQAAHRTGSP